MVKSTQSYEEIRKQRLEENSKRMEDLNLTKLAQKLRDDISPKPSPMKHSKPRTPNKEMTLVPVRRSSRVANLPAPVYKEVIVEVLERTKRFFKGRDWSNRVYASDDARASATCKAEELMARLENENGFPSFVKPMLQSHVTGGFWLGLPSWFCRKHLPKNDCMIDLVDREGEEFPTVYLPRKTGLSGGWKAFSIAHNLVDGDALVFELVRPTEFKVYIKRVNGSDEEPIKLIMLAQTESALSVLELRELTPQLQQYVMMAQGTSFFPHGGEVKS